jgi:hypothetical protein
VIILRFMNFRYEWGKDLIHSEFGRKGRVEHVMGGRCWKNRPTMELTITTGVTDVFKHIVKLCASQILWCI